MRTLKARYPGKCEGCGQAFPAGEEIAWDGKAWHAECRAKELQREAAQQAEDDARDAERWAEATRRFRAGENVSISLGQDERYGCHSLTVRGAYNYEQAKDAAWAAVYSIRAAGGTAELLKHKGAKGKWHFGRQLGYYATPSSTSWIDGGVGFRLLVNETFAEWKARRAAAREEKLAASA
jgi:hypothetical protein